VEEERVEGELGQVHPVEAAGDHAATKGGGATSL